MSARERPLRLPPAGGIHLPRCAVEEPKAAPPRAGELSAEPTEGALGHARSNRPGLLIFDFDGVIADSEALANQVLADRLSALGFATSLDEAFEHYLGRNWSDCLSAFERLWGCEAPSHLRREIELEISRRLPDLKPVPGALEFIARTAADRRCIASSSHPDWIVERLALFGLAGAFEGAIFSAAVHVRRGKPHPDIHLHAMQRMGALPQATWIIEDSVTGVMAGAAAGASVIGLCAASHCRDGHAERLAAAGASTVCHSFAEVAAVLL